VSQSIAKEFEVGTMRTISSYPISRRKLLFIKLGTVLLIACFFVTIAETLPVLILSGYVDVFQFLGPVLTALTLQIWIILSVTSLTSLLYRNSAFSTLVGIGLGYIMMMSSIFNMDYPLPLRTILYPITGVQELYIYGEVVLSDLYLGFVGGVVLGFALLLLCIFVFSKMEL
jgi:ABC-type transport system involved in multi-copper enzyme maturation permease subunit